MTNPMFGGSRHFSHEWLTRELEGGCAITGEVQRATAKGTPQEFAGDLSLDWHARILASSATFAVPRQNFFHRP